jgi:hypothetical protein
MRDRRRRVRLEHLAVVVERDGPVAAVRPVRVYGVAG